MKQNLLKTCLVMLFAVLGFGMSWAQSQLYTCDFTSVSPFSYAQNKTFSLGGKQWKASVAQVNSGVFYLGCNSSNAAKGVLNDNGDFADVYAAVAAEDDNVTNTSHEYALLFNNEYKNVANVEFAWDGGNNAFQVYLFGDMGAGWLLLEQTDYAEAAYNVAGSVKWSSAGSGVDFTRFAIVARPGTPTTVASNKTLRAKSFTLVSGPATETYTVTFNAGTNGTCSTTSLTEASAGAGVTLPAVTANEGFAFQGWSTSETPSSADAGVAGETYNPLADVTLYAYYTVARPANEVFYESFDKNAGTGGNDNLWSGSIASNNIQYDNEGWVVANASGASHCAKFGAGSKLGSATTPAIAASGYFTLSFKAGAWNGNNESTTLKLSATGATLSAETVTLTKGAWDTYSVNILNATEGFTVTFEGNAASNSRFFLDEVSVLTADAPVATYTKQTLEFVASQPEAYGDVYYATFSSSKGAFIPDLDYDGDEYLTQVFTVNVEDGKLNVDEVDYDWSNYITIGGRDYAGYYIPANTGVLVSGNFDTPSHRIIYFDVENVEIPVITNTNLLRPASAAMEGDYNFYKLAYNDYEAGTGLGFYWGAANGAAFEAKVGGAYLAVPKSASSAKGFRFDGGDVTGIKAAAIEKSGNIYNLQGQRVSRIQQGVNIVNGKKVVR